MKKSSFKKLSLFGLVLMGASAITTAMLPKDTTGNSKLVQNGELTTSFGTNINNTCRTRDEIFGVPEAANCHDTDSEATNPLSFSSESPGRTSHDAGNPLDSNTSVMDNE